MKKLIALSVFLISLVAQSQCIKLLDFAGAPNGKWPNGDLYYDGTYLYGMTNRGGANDSGLIFKIKPDSTGYTGLFDFKTKDGVFPNGSLISDGTFLYGMTSEGGAYGGGNIFKIKPDGTGFDTLLNFNTANGALPFGSLLYDGTFLYGTTKSGGANNFGLIFKIKPDGSNYTDLLDFDDTLHGKNCTCTLIYDGTFLYGTTTGGGVTSNGTIFKIKPDGSGYVKLRDFAGAPDGDAPQGSLVSDGTFLYGMTDDGGTHNDGTIYKIKTDGSSYTKLYDFSGTPNGNLPDGSLIYDGTYLYGMTIWGGINGIGTIFKIKPNGSGYSQLLDFADGGWPYGSLISDGTYLYGMTQGGGAYNFGTVFKYQFAHCATVSDSIFADATPHTWDVIPNYSLYDTSAIWSWGDGTYTTGLYPSHTYTTAGWYNVCVTAYSSCGDSASTCHNDSLYKMANNTGNSMVYINVLHQTASTNQNLINKNQIFIYPNPTSDQFFIETTITAKLNVDLYDMNGRHVLNASVSDKENINVASLDNGAYTVTIKTADRVINKKLVILR